MSIITKTLPYPQGESVCLRKKEGDDFFIFTPPDDWPDSENVVVFIAKDKKGLDILASRLQQIIHVIKHHNDNCDCS
jgi:hypothetical protein